MKPQDFDNHARRPPLPFLVAIVAAALPAGHFIFETIGDFNNTNLSLAMLSVACFLAISYARTFALGVQNRVIRLEERLRLERLLDGDARGRIEEITTDQLIGLRFASDEELPGLVGRVLDGTLTDRRAIKEAVRNWRGDYERI